MRLNNRKLQIACDGGGATGKSTGAKMIAKKYDLKFLSSGLLYRYASYLILKYKPKKQVIFSRKKFKTLNYSKLNRINLPKISDFKKKKSEYLKKLKSIMKTIGAKPSMTMRDVRVNYFNALLNRADKKGKLSKSVRQQWLSRWVDNNKSVNIRVLRKNTPDYMLSDTLSIEKDLSKHNKQLILPLEKLFLKLGADGKPIYNENGKVMKGPNYFKPNLNKFVA